MKTFSSKNTKWMPLVLIVGVIAGSLATSAYLCAGPIAVTKEEKNTSNKTIWKRAKYIPDTLAAYTIHSKTENSDPSVILVGQLVADILLPGKDKTNRVLGLCYMYVNEEDLTTFPHALKIANRDKIICDLINTKDQIQGLNQLRNAYAKAHGISVDDLPPIEE